MKASIFLKILPFVILALSLSLACSAPPPRAKFGGTGVAAPYQSNNTVPPSPGGLDNHPGDKPIFAVNLTRLDSLIFRSILNKLAFIADVDPEKVEQEPAFAKLIANRYNLGDYNYALGNIGNRQWESSQMTLWLESLIPYCQDKAIKTKYTSKVDVFIKAAMGRDPTADEMKFFATNAALSGDANMKFEAVCAAFLSSLEFRNQWASSSPTFKDFLSILSSTILQQPLASTVAPEGDLEGTLEAWTNSPRFQLSTRQFMDQLIRSSGSSGEMDYDLPSNLFNGIIKKKLPYSQILTSDVCYNRLGVESPCDSDAPFKAGVLTSRAFLQRHAGPFNLSRANGMLGTFACLKYPLAPALEPPMKADEMIDTFAKTSGQGFGNGTNCYLCHSQFGKHAQFFVKFDATGHYVKDADGLQNPDPKAASGNSLNQTFVSHMLGKSAAASEASAFFGNPAKNLAEAAAVLAKSDEFLDCSIRHVLGYYLRIEDKTRDSISPDLIRDIRANIRKASPDPVFPLIVKKSLSHPKVIQSFLQKGSEAQ